MNLLLDTHILIWALNDDPQLSDRAKEMILDPANVIYYSVVSIWEVSIKHTSHPNDLEFSGKELSGYCREAGFLSLDIRDKHIYALETLQRPENAPRHNDPFDRMLVAQAKAENMCFLTHDSLIPYYEEKCIIPV